jgi:dephospho-CoA kinase
MIKIGLTGGIGSGKSTVARIFCALGIPVFNSDEEAKKLYTSDNILREKLLSTFGTEIYLGNGEINKSFLINTVFTHEQKLKLLNSIVHPRVKISFEVWLNNHEHLPCVIKEAAILFESGAYRQVDKIIVVTAPVELRIKRVMERDGVDRESVLLRINRQYPEEKLISMSDYTIDNSGSKLVVKQVLDFIGSLRK